MKRLIAVIVLAIAAMAPLAMAQTGQSRPLADVAREEEARRKSVRKPAKVYKNGDLTPDTFKPVAPPPSTTSAADAAGNSTPGNTTPGGPDGAKPEVKDEAYWQGRMKAARATQERLQIFADSLQSRINALTTEYVNRDDPAQRSKVEQDKNTALAELERVKKELDDQAKAILAIEDEARRAGVPPGWLRPGV